MTSHLDDTGAGLDLIEAAAVEGYRAIGGDRHDRVCREKKMGKTKNEDTKILTCGKGCLDKGSGAMLYVCSSQPRRPRTPRRDEKGGSTLRVVCKEAFFYLFIPLRSERDQRMIICGWYSCRETKTIKPGTYVLVHIYMQVYLYVVRRFFLRHLSLCLLRPPPPSFLLPLADKK